MWEWEWVNWGWYKGSVRCLLWSMWARMRWNTLIKRHTTHTLDFIFTLCVWVCVWFSHRGWIHKWECARWLIQADAISQPATRSAAFSSQQRKVERDDDRLRWLAFYDFADDMPSLDRCMSLMSSDEWIAADIVIITIDVYNSVTRWVFGYPNFRRRRQLDVSSRPRARIHWMRCI